MAMDSKRMLTTVCTCSLMPTTNLRRRQADTFNFVCLFVCLFLENRYLGFKKINLSEVIKVVDSWSRSKPRSLLCPDPLFFRLQWLQADFGILDISHCAAHQLERPACHPGNFLRINTCLETLESKHTIPALMRPTDLSCNAQDKSCLPWALHQN